MLVWCVLVCYYNSAKAKGDIYEKQNYNFNRLWKRNSSTS